ncbi:MAG: efflux RND transporter permease subunit [Acidobacteriota bacterium]|nr:efflux RND transporter permease subunit [Acidobacteriota bacterium]
MTHGENSQVEGLTRWSLNRRITVLMVLLSILVVGTIAALGIPLEMLPRGFEDKYLSVVVPWQDAPTREVLEKVTYPLEEELSTVKGLSGMWSYSRTSRAWVGLNFKQGVDMDVAYREVRDRVERARALFPDDAERVFIRKDDASGLPVAAIGIAMDPDISDPETLMETEIIRPLERIDGVASVEAEGHREREIIIELDREATAAAGLNIWQLSNQLSDDNFTMASGNVRDSGKKFLLRSVATYDSLDALRQRPINSRVRLGDIAEIRYEEPERNFEVRVNSAPATALMVMKEGEANAVEVSRKIDDALAVMNANPRLKGFEMEALFSQGQIVTESINNLGDSGKIGGVLAALVLFIFLRRFSLTAIITLSIPLSLLIALAAMYFMGETLNILTILALIVCVGLLVDNSVVVAENIHRLYRDGLSRRDACIRGAGEIALAVVMATLTTVVVFLPVALVEGEGQFFLMRLALPITVSLIASLFIALAFVPLAVYLTLDKRDQPEKKGVIAHVHNAMHAALRLFYDRVFLSVNHFYNKALAYFLKHRLDLVVLLFAIFGVTMAVTKDNLKVVPRQEEDATRFRIRVDMDREYNYDDVKAWFSDVEKIMAEHKEELELSYYLLVTYRGGGRIDGFFREDRENKITLKQAAEKIVGLIPESPGVKLYTGDEDRNSDKEKKETYVVRLVGEDYELLDEVAEDLEPSLLRFPGVLGVRRSGETSPSELGLVIDRDRAQAGGVNPQWVAGVVGYALRGSSLPRYNDNGKQINVRVRFREQDRENLSDLANFQVPTQDGNAVSLDSLTTSTMLKTARGVFRRDKKVSRRITLDLEDENAVKNRQALAVYVNNLDLPEGVSIGQPSIRVSDDLDNMKLAVYFSIIFIYLLMGFLFESFSLPWSILLTIPMAIIGVGWAHFITGKNLDILGTVGMVLLIGVVVNNGIVLIDYVNRLRRSGMARTEALLLASERRFRPIVMTALTTIIGMVPLTISKPLSLGISYKSFGLTLIGGMTTATVLTLLVVPVFYSMIDDLGRMRKQAFRLGWGLPETPTTDP